MTTGRKGAGRDAKDLTASDEFDDLEGVAFFEEGRGVGGLGEDLAVALDGHARGRDLQALEKVSDGGTAGETQFLAVDADRDLRGGAHGFPLTGNLNSVAPMGDFTRITAAAEPSGRSGTGKVTGQAPSAPVIPWKTIPPLPEVERIRTWTDAPETGCRDWED